MSTARTSYQFDNEAGGDHVPELYNPERNAYSIPTLAHFNDEAIAYYHEHGHICVDQVYTPEETHAGITALTDLVEGRNPSFNDLYFEASARRGIDQLEATQRLDLVRKIGAFVKHDQRLDGMAHKPELMDVISRLLGGERPMLCQDMALIKPPKIGREKPWHQDNAYFDFDVQARVVGIWIALDEATIANGCMQVIDGGHRQGPILHWRRRDWQICDTDMLGQRSVACPLKPGGALFFDGLIPHGTPKNNSEQRRRALQFHYVRPDIARITGEERLKIFGTDGKDVTC